MMTQELSVLMSPDTCGWHTQPGTVAPLTLRVLTFVHCVLYWGSWVVVN